MTSVPSEQALEGGAARVPLPGRALVPVLGGLAFLLVAALFGLLVGPVHIGVGAVARSALSHVPFLGVHSSLSDVDSAIIWELRAPRVVLAMLVGGMLALAGGAYQGVFRNPLVDPYLLGVAAGAGLGATLAIAYGGAGVRSYDLLPLAAFLGAALGVMLSYVLGQAASGGRSTASLVLAGVTVVAFLTAVQTFVQQQNSESLQEVYSWILGSLATSGWHDVALVAPYIVVSSVVILLCGRLLDVLSVGDEEAATLGVNVGRIRLAVVVAATVGTAAAVAVSGLIAFVGIIVPHAIRLAIGTSYRIVLPLSLLVGAGFLVLADVLARTVVAPAELPIGVVTAFFGAPFFAVLLRTTRSFT
ncbi:MAG TPA: iron ABC transporter permease [Gaiellaceae bacterium]